jgi:hypothetical protein
MGSLYVIVVQVIETLERRGKADRLFRPAFLVVASSTAHHKDHGVGRKR